MADNGDPDRVDLRDYLVVLRRHKLMIALIALGSVALALGVSFLQAPVYEGSAEILLQPRGADSVFDSSRRSGSAQAASVETEIRVLESDLVRRLVAEELGSAPAVLPAPRPARARPAHWRT